MGNRLKMNPENSNQQRHQQPQRQERLPNGQQPEPSANELAQELVQQQHKLNKLMVNSAQKHTANAQLQIRLLAIKKK